MRHRWYFEFLGRSRFGASEALTGDDPLILSSSSLFEFGFLVSGLDLDCTASTGLIFVVFYTLFWSLARWEIPGTNLSNDKPQRAETNILTLLADSRIAAESEEQAVQVRVKDARFSVRRSLM